MQRRMISARKSKAATPRSLNRRVTYRIGVHTLPDSFFVSSRKAIHYSVNLALIIAVVLHPSKLDCVT